jgi:glucokinase
MLPLLEEDRFRDAFLGKGRLRHFVETVPVRVIRNDEATLLGAAAHGLASLLRV